MPLQTVTMGLRVSLVAHPSLKMPWGVPAWASPEFTAGDHELIIMLKTDLQEMDEIRLPLVMHIFIYVFRRSHRGGHDIILCSEN